MAVQVTDGQADGRTGGRADGQVTAQGDTQVAERTTVAPVVAPSGTVVEEVDSARPPVRPSARPPDTVNILLVDDQPANLVALEAMLQGLGQNLIKAESGREALKWLLTHETASRRLR